MNTISTINLLPSSKSEIKSFAESAKSLILSGNENPLKIAAQLKAMEELIDLLRKDKDIREVTLKEAEKESKIFTMYGAEFQIKEVGVKYDYSVCDDAEWFKLEKEIKSLTDKKKEREDFLKSIKGEVFDSNGVQLNPPAKSSTTNVNVTIK